MAKIKSLTNRDGEVFYPLTHTDAVLDKQGKSVSTRFSEMEQSTNEKLAEVEAETNAKITELEENKVDKNAIVQETGDSETEVMSQKAVSEKLAELESRTEILEEDQQLIRDTMAQNKQELKTDVAETKQRIEQVAVAVEEIEQTIIEGDVINAPDEEDLTTDEDNRLKFKDRPALNGMGYVILRKNFVDGKNLLTQEMVDQPNTIYEIRYDFDLNGETVTLKEGCTLYFCGGKLDKGVLNGKYTNIKSISTSLPIFGENLSINNVIADEAYSEYFEDVSSDATTLIQKCLDVFYRCTLNEGKTYCISNSILLKYGRKLSGKPRSMIKTLNDGFSLFKLGSNSTLEHLYVDLDDKTQNVIHIDSELIGSTFHEYMNEEKPEESADSWKYMNYANIRVNDISVMSTAAPIEYTNNRQLYCFESFANGKGTGYWGIYFTNINVYGAGYDYVIVIDNSNSGQTWQTDQEWKNIKIRKAKNGILVTKSDTNGFPPENITFDHVSMQYYEDTNSYEDANGEIKYAHFIKFDAVNRANLRNCIDWDFPVGRTWHINPNRCQGVKIENQPISGNSSPEIHLTETVNGAATFSPVVVNSYRSSAGAVQLLHSYITTEELRFKMTHEIITRLPSGIYAISPEYSYRIFLGIDASIPIVMDFDYAYLKVEWWSLGRGILTLYTANSLRGCPQSPIATLPYAVTSANLSEPIGDWMITMPPMQAYESVDDFYNATHVSAGKTQGILATTTKGMLIHKSPQWFITNALGFTAAPIVGSTAKRPTDKLHTWEDTGFMYYDTTLKKPIWWTGSTWVDATGAEV